jgi:hypothetical protein
MDLDALADPELMNELQSRRCFIYPSGNKIIIKRKNEVPHSIELLVDAYPSKADCKMTHTHTHAALASE